MKNELKTLCGLNETVATESFQVSTLELSAALIGIVSYLLTLIA